MKELFTSLYTRLREFLFHSQEHYQLFASNPPQNLFEQEWTLTDEPVCKFLDSAHGPRTKSWRSSGTTPQSSASTSRLLLGLRNVNLVFNGMSPTPLAPPAESFNISAAPGPTPRKAKRHIGLRRRREHPDGCHAHRRPRNGRVELVEGMLEQVEMHKAKISLYINNVPELLMRHVWLEADVPICGLVMDSPLPEMTTRQDRLNEFEFYLRKHH